MFYKQNGAATRLCAERACAKRERAERERAEKSGLRGSSLRGRELKKSGWRSTGGIQLNQKTEYFVTETSVAMCSYASKCTCFTIDGSTELVELPESEVVGRWSTEFRTQA